MRARVDNQLSELNSKTDRIFIGVSLLLDDVWQLSNYVSSSCTEPAQEMTPSNMQRESNDVVDVAHTSCKLLDFAMSCLYFDIANHRESDTLSEPSDLVVELCHLKPPAHAMVNTRGTHLLCANIPNELLEPLDWRSQVQNLDSESFRSWEKQRLERNY